MILFIALKCGEGDQDHNAALQFTLKLAAPSIGYDEGSSTGSTIGKSRGRKRQAPSSSEDLDGIMTNMADTIGACVKDGALDMANAIRGMFSSNETTETAEDKAISRRGVLLKKLTALCKQISTVRDEAPGLLRFYEQQQSAIVTEIEKLDVIDMVGSP